MKFGHLFAARLQKDGFPPTWVDHAISYHQLKRCIHRLENELFSLGLTPDTLKQLLKSVENYNARSDAAVASTDQPEDQEKPFEYILSSPEARALQDAQDDANSEGKNLNADFHPKLLFTVDAATGESLSANLSPETKIKLHQLALENDMSNVRVTEVAESYEDPSRNSSISSHRTASSQGAVRTIEVPLTSDSEFFSLLSSQLSGIADLQSEEEKRLHASISELSQSILNIFEENPGKRKEIRDIVRWRQILNAYVECNVFFETKPSMKVVAHSVAEAETQLQLFSKIITEEKLAIKFKSKYSQAAANQFVKINQDLLQILRFQELNNMAMNKILKKFDKRTALGVKSTFPTNIHIPVFTDKVAKAVCFTLNSEIIDSVPKLNDYICPICSDIAWRPVRLECNHVFCIRCLIVMQENKQDKCPLCRKNAVMKAYAVNLDDDLMKYLKRWFPDEVKLKQKENEYLAGIDQYGEAYKTKCTVM